MSPSHQRVFLLCFATWLSLLPSCHAADAWDDFTNNLATDLVRDGYDYFGSGFTADVTPDTSDCFVWRTSHEAVP